MANLTMKEAIAHFTRYDVVAAPVNTIPQAAHDSHPWERRAMVEVPDFLAGTYAKDVIGNSVPPAAQKAFPSVDTIMKQKIVRRRAT